jgi:hypothetical protein
MVVEHVPPKEMLPARMTNMHEIELAVIQELLAEPRWSRSGLKVKLERFTPEEVDGTIVMFSIEGLCDFDGRAVQASQCLRWLHDRGLLTLAAPNGSPPRAPDRETLDRILAAHRREE